MAPRSTEPDSTLRTMLGRGRRVAGAIRRRARALPGTVRENIRRVDVQARPYTYDPERYRVRFGTVVVPNSWTFPVNHLEFAPAGEGLDLTPAPHVIYCFWTGENSLTPQRERSLESLRAMNPRTPLTLITAMELEDYLAPGSPLHPAYEHLSTNHRSDYLRAYFMLHHGGVYMDIKSMTGPWAPLLDRLNSSPTAWCIGPEELSAFNVSPAMGIMGEDQRRNFSSLPCQSGFAFKPGSPLARAWYDEVQRRMNYHAGLLADHPAQDVFGSNQDYPVAWNALHGSIFSPLSLRYHEHVLTDPGITFDLRGGYR